MPRLFAAFLVPAEDAVAFAEVCRPLAAAVPAASLARPKNTHVTVRFFGDVADGSVPALIDALAAAVAGRQAFDMPYEGIRFVPPDRLPNKLWAAYGDDGRFRELVAAVSEAAGPFAPRQDVRDAAPHATLVRFRDGVPLAMGRGPAPVVAAKALRADKMLLYSSRTLPGGPEHELLAEYPLSA